ncbi:MAG: hypothetical protein ACYCXI_09015 [Dethiobacteraceae bacterium]
MTKNNLLPQLLSAYFIKYIPERSGYSDNTIKSYRDTFILLFRYQGEVVKQPVNKLSFEETGSTLNPSLNGSRNKTIIQLLV